MTDVGIDLACGLIFVLLLTAHGRWCGLGIRIELLHQGVVRGFCEVLHPGLDSCGENEWLALGRLLHCKPFSVFRLDVGDHVLPDALALSRDLGHNLIDTLIDLLDVLVDGDWVQSLADDFEQIFIRQEIETREVSPLGRKQVIELLLDDFKVEVQFVKDANKVTSVLDRRPVGVLDLVNASHLGTECQVYRLEDRVLLGELLLDMGLSAKDTL